MRDLPKGWVEVPIGDVCGVVGGSTPSTKVAEYWDGDIPWLTPDDLARDHSQYVFAGRRTITKAGFESCSTQIVSPGTVLFTSRAPIGYIAIARQPLCTNQGFKSFVPPDGLSSEYLYWYLRWATPAIREMGSGTTFAEISGKVAKTIPLRVAPRQEQDRIVAAIEEQFSRIDEGVSAVQSARRRCEQLRVSVLSGSMSGDWPTKKIGEFASVGSGATPKRGRADYYEGGTIPWVTSGQLVHEFVTEPSAYITDKALRETSVKVWPKHTLLVAMYGEGRTRGHCSELLFESTTNQACAAVVVPEDAPVARAHLKLFFAANYERNRRLAAGGVQPNLSLGLIRSMEVPVPPIDEQSRIVDDVDRQLSAISALDRAGRDAVGHADALRRSILERAFAGRLVPQDPADMPASALLDIISAQRTSQSRVRRKRT